MKQKSPDGRRTVTSQNGWHRKWNHRQHLTLSFPVPAALPSAVPHLQEGMKGCRHYLVSLLFYLL
jgi:hypothetical protein